MKRSFFAFFMFAICMVFSVCRKTAKPPLDLDSFQQENRLVDIVRSINRFSTIHYADSLQFSREYQQLQQHLDYLVKKYGKQQAKAFAREMLRTTAATGKVMRSGQGCCRLDANGTTDQSCCNFWESVVVAFETLDCSRPYPGAPEPQIREFYECIQAEVCENC